MKRGCARSGGMLLRPARRDTLRRRAARPYLGNKSDRRAGVQLPDCRRVTPGRLITGLSKLEAYARTQRPMRPVIITLEPAADLREPQ